MSDPYHKSCSICGDKYHAKGLCRKHYTKQYDMINKDRIKGWKTKNRDKFRIYSNKYRINNPINSRNSKKKWVINNPHKCNKYSKKHYKNNKQKCDLAVKTWVKKNPDKVLIYMKNRFDKISKTIDIESHELRYMLISWAKMIKNRDITCTVCNSSKNLHSHHMFYKSKYPKLCLNINNGIVLCSKCHYELHSLNGF